MAHESSPRGPSGHDNTAATAVAISKTATLSADHQVIDGALGAKLLAALKAFIQDPITLLV
jgi:pyruvate dehydrogenase E2 component (dihydrolipoamide acetyltransferase)